MKLTFVNSSGNERELAICDSESDAMEKIREFLNDHNYKSYYFKVSLFPFKQVYDVGSWSEFFILYNNNDVELNKYDVWEGL